MNDVKVKLAKYLADFLVERGMTDMFSVTGGGAMHLNDAFGHHPGLLVTYNHHEQACAIAAEGYARLSGRVAGVCVTSGPGGTNALTGVLGGWLDSIPMFIISGQVKRETTTWSTDVALRQLGDQEFQIIGCAETMSKYAIMVTEPKTIRYHLEKAWYLMMHGRRGPVWLDIPLDVQATLIETDDLEGFDPSELVEPEQPVYDTSQTSLILERLALAERPVILAGAGIRLGDAYAEFRDLIEILQIPVVTAWNSNDLLPDDHPLFCGRPATVGTRGGNFVVQAADVLLSLGSRLNIRLISYNRKQFAKDAYKIVVDIDEAELRKPTIDVDLPVHADVKDVMRALADPDALDRSGYRPHDARRAAWAIWARGINECYPATVPEYFAQQKPINPYVFIDRLSDALTEGDDIICGNGSACVVTFQAFRFKERQRSFTNSGCAAMGYGFPAAIGCCRAEGPDKRVICIDGDGSFQMNIQELQTVVCNHLNLKLFIINNNGYHSIRQTQTNTFEPPLVGVCEGSGLSFPDLEKIAAAYGLPYVRIEDRDKATQSIAQVLDIPGPVLCEVIVDENQKFEPKLSSKVLPDGRIVSPDLDDMFPFLPREEYDAVKNRSGLFE
jgi:acetolactate synthase I/II/III large subunit